MRWVRPGVAGPADSSDARSLTAAPLADVVADLAAVVAVERPDLIVSYDDAGGYGHPDHLRAREAALAVARASDIRFAELIDDPKLPGTEWFSLEHQRDAVLAALRSHRTQLTVDTDGRQLTHSGGQRQDVETDIGLRIVT
jgi:N-acetyl-1-D-myo-inositol-2-amino-2-deoxy-alpha-D-glucopyranoside deacetylase